MARLSSDKQPVPYLRDYNKVRNMVFDGKVFGVTNVTIGTGITGQTGTTYTSATSTFSFRNAGSKVLVPVLGILTQTGTVADIRITVHVSTTETSLFSSGTALTAYNRNQNSGAQPTVLPFHTVTHTSAANPDTSLNRKLRHSLSIFQTVTADNPGNGPVSIFPYPGFTMVRPGGTLDVYSLGSSSAPTWFFDIQWAELDI